MQEIDTKCPNCGAQMVEDDRKWASLAFKCPHCDTMRFFDHGRYKAFAEERAKHSDKPEMINVSTCGTILVPVRCDLTGIEERSRADAVATEPIQEETQG